MKLRSRLALALGAAAVPLLAATVWARGAIERRDADRSLREFALARMESGGRERCEADPAYFAIVAPPPADAAGGARSPVRLAEPADGAPPPAPPPLPEGGRAPDVPSAAGGAPVTELWAFDGALRSRNPRAPELPDDLAEALRGGAAQASAPWGAGGAPGRQLALRTPWPDGPCAVVLVRRVDAAAGEFASFAIWSAAAVAAAMIAVVAFAAGAVVRRIRRLTEAVERSAGESYRAPVDESGGDEIADLARSFNAAGRAIRGNLDELSRREETLRTFLANTTHDVMTPLTVLQGHLSAIRRAASEGRTIDAEAANAAAEEAHYLASLVHNLAAVAKLDAGLEQVHLAPVNLNDVVQRVVERHWSLASPRAIEISFAVPEAPVWFDADVTLLEQAVGNVVGNAVRYNRAGGHVAVLLEEAAPRAFSLRVVDDGPGVPDAQLAELGRRAFRTDDARRRHPEGTGLGLDIVRRVAEFHRLQLAFRRSEHGGLEVELRGVRGDPPKSARS